MSVGCKKICMVVMIVLCMHFIASCGAVENETPVQNEPPASTADGFPEETQSDPVESNTEPEETAPETVATEPAETEPETLATEPAEMETEEESLPSGEDMGGWA